MQICTNYFNFFLSLRAFEGDLFLCQTA